MKPGAKEKKEGSKMYTIYWLIAVGVFLLVEILTLGLTSIWFAGGALVASFTAFLGAPLFFQLIVFIVVTCVLFMLTRPWAQRFFNNSVEKTNAEALIGKHAIVKNSIDNKRGKGTVFINGMDWSARSVNGEEIPEETEVLIHEIQGVKLVVEPVDEPVVEPVENLEGPVEEEMQNEESEGISDNDEEKQEEL